MTVKSSPPAASITVPPNGAVLPAGQAVPVDITASDASGVTHVEVWIDGLLYASWNSTNPAGETQVMVHFAWQNPAAGSHAMYAVAFNKSGASTQTATIQVTVTASTATRSPSATPVPSQTPTPTSTLSPIGTATP